MNSNPFFHYYHIFYKRLFSLQSARSLNNEREDTDIQQIVDLPPDEEKGLVEVQEGDKWLFQLLSNFDTGKEELDTEISEEKHHTLWPLFFLFYQNKKS